MLRWTIHLLSAVLTLALAAPGAWAGANSVFSIDGTDVWAVGSGGRFFRSLDGGQSYAAGTLGSKALNGVAANGFTVLAVGDSGKVWRTSDSGGSWAFQVPSGTSPLRAVAMPSGTIAYAAGDGGRILKSIDGGASWSAQTSGTSEHLRALRFTSEDDGWAVGHGGAVLQTTDGGANWAPVASGTTNDLFDVDVFGSTVWVVGGLGTARKSTNGGANWSAINLRLDAKSDVRGVSLVSADSVVLVGGGGFVRISGDGGTTWTFAEHTLFGSASSVHHAGQKSFVANGDTMGVMRTTVRVDTLEFPTGTTISRVLSKKFEISGASVRGNTLAFNWQNPRTLYFMLVNRVYVSRDEGETWSTIGNTVSGSTKVNGFIVSPKDSTEWVAAISDPDRIVRSTNSGQSWSTRLTMDFGEYGVPLEMDPDDPDTLYFGPDNDVLYRSTDFGQSWSAYSNTSFRSPCDIVVVPESDSSTIFVADGVTSVGNSELWRATDGDLDFTLQYVGGTGSSEIPSVSISRLKPDRAFLMSWSAVNPRYTTDEGLTWPVIAQLASVTSTWGTDIARDDPNMVIISKFGGGLSYLSTDGGTDWDAIPHSGSNYAVMSRDRGVTLQLHSTGIFKQQFTYTYTPGGAQSLSLADPNGGEVWDAGSTQAIEWSAANVAQAEIEYRISSGDPWVPIATVPGYLGTYDWLVPDDPTFTAEVRVRDGWDGAPSDISASTFTIAAPRIEASPDPLDFGPVAKGTESVLVLTIDNPGTALLDVTAASVQTPAFAIGRSAFTIAAGGSDTLAVTFNPALVQAYEDTLELASNVNGSPLRVPLAGAGIDTLMLALVAPVGGETWQYGSAHQIQWQSSLVESVTVEYSADGGAPWTTIAASVPADSSGSWWLIPDAETELARVRIREVSGTAADSSAALFTIAVPRLMTTPQQANIGMVTIGQARAIQIGLSNIGSSILDVSSIMSDDADFTPNAFSMSLGVGAWDSLFVTFDPQTVGADSAMLTIVTNGPESPVLILVTGEGTNTVDATLDRPVAFALGQNHPNPFAGRTTIRYALPVRAPVVLDVYDLQGHRVATLVDGIQEPGTYAVPFGPGVSTADGRLRDVRAGVYFYRLRAGSFVATRKMLFLR